MLAAAREALRFQPLSRLNYADCQHEGKRARGVHRLISCWIQANMKAFLAMLFTFVEHLMDISKVPK